MIKSKKLARALALPALFVTLMLGVGEMPGADARPDVATANAGWEEMGAGSATGGGISNNTGKSDRPALAFGADGAPIIAWEDESNGYGEIYVRRWSGSAWVEMGGSASGGGISSTAEPSWAVSVAVSSSGPVVAWANEVADQNEILVRRWNGSAWVEMGVGSASGGGISNNSGRSAFPSIAIGADDMPIIAWEDESNGNREIYVRRWNGSAWVEMGAGSASDGGISNNTGASEHPSLAIAPGGPIVAWDDDINGNKEIYVRRWNGSAWEDIGTGSASGGGISNNSGRSGTPSVAVGVDDAPVVAWDDESSGDAEIYVRRWNGLVWVEMGAGSATGGGISNNGKTSWGPTLAIDSDNAPIVAWRDDSSSNFETYVRRWNGSTWVEIDVGSASGGGVSNNSGLSTKPYLVIGPDSAPILAWGNESGVNREIYVRRYDKNIPVTQKKLYAPVVFDIPYQPPPCLLELDETEPNDNGATANGPLCNGQTYFGSPDDDFDVFYFELASVGSISVVMADHPGDEVQLALHYEEITNHALDIDGNPNDGYQVAKSEAQPGKYFVVVYDKPPVPGPPLRYTLRATFGGE